MENDSKRKIKIPERTMNYLFYCGAGRFILRSPEWITFFDVALRFVEEVQIRFELALECGNIDDTFECATKISTKKCWNRFGEAASMQRNYRYVNEAYKQINFEKLMYLFVLTYF